MKQATSSRLARSTISSTSSGRARPCSSTRSQWCTSSSAGFWSTSRSSIPTSHLQAGASIAADRSRRARDLVETIAPLASLLFRM